MESFKKSICCVLVFSMIFLQSCNRPLFVTHWIGKDKALLKKKGWGWPNHGVMANVVCTNKMCLDKAERINKRESMRFKGFKNKNHYVPSDKPLKLKPDSIQNDGERMYYPEKSILK